MLYSGAKGARAPKKRLQRQALPRCRCNRQVGNRSTSAVRASIYAGGSRKYDFGSRYAGIESLGTKARDLAMNALGVQGEGGADDRRSDAAAAARLA